MASAGATCRGTEAGVAAEGGRAEAWEAMGVIEHKECIKAPLQAVFDYIAHPERNKEWIPDVEDSRKLTDGPNGPGSRFEFVTRAPMGVHVTAEAEITEMRPPYTLAFRSLSGFEHRGRWELEERNGITCVRFRIEYRLSGVEAVVLRATGLRHFLARHVKGSVRGLRSVLETGCALAKERP